MAGQIILAGGTLHVTGYPWQNRTITPGGGWLVQDGTTSHVIMDHALNYTLKFAGNVSGAGTLVFSGNGVLTSWGIATNWTDFSGTIDVRDGATIGNAASGFLRSLTEDATVKISSGGTVHESGGAPAVSADIILAGGTLLKGANSLSINGSLTVDADSTITFTSGQIRLNGTLSGSGNIALTTAVAPHGLYLDALFNSSDFTGSIDFATSTSVVSVNTNTDTGGSTAITLHVGGLTGDGTVRRNKSGTGTVILQPGSGKSYTFNGQLTNPTGSLVLQMNGPGTQVLNGNNSYSGGTTISGGTLVVGHANALGTTGTITLNGGTLAVGSGVEFTRSFTFNGGTLGGDGTFAQDITVGAGKIVAPGMSVGTLSFNNLVMGNGSIWNFEFDGSDNDQIIVLGTLSIDGGGIFNLYQEGTTAAYVAPGEYYLIQYGELYADWDAPNFGLTVAGLSPDDYFFSTDGEWIMLTVTGVPEPATMAFLALGGLAMAGGAIRRRRTA